MDPWLTDSKVIRQELEALAEERRKKEAEARAKECTRCDEEMPRKLLGAPSIATRSKKLLAAKGIAIRSKNAFMFFSVGSSF